MRGLTRLSSLVKHPKIPFVAVVAGALVVLVGGMSFAARSASDHLANATFGKLGDPHDVLDKIADKVVDKLTQRGGTLDSAKSDLVRNLTSIAGRKLGGVDAAKLVDDVRGKVVSAGLSKINGINTDTIVDNVTAAVIAQVSEQVARLNLGSMAKSMLSSVDLEKVVRQELDKIDLEAIVQKAIDKAADKYAKEYADSHGGSSSGSSSPNLFDLFGAP